MEEPRVYHIGTYSQPEIDLKEALRALRAYSVHDLSRPETIELNLKYLSTYNDERSMSVPRMSVYFPHLFGEPPKIMCVAEPEDVQRALDAGAHIAGGSELLEKIKEGDLDFDVCICTPKMLPDFKPLQIILKSKIPTVKRGTVTDDVAETIAKLRSSKQFSPDNRQDVKVTVGTLDFPYDHVKENIKVVASALLAYRGAIPKRFFFKKASICSTYGPGYKLSLKEML